VNELRSGLAAAVGDQETVARFLPSSGWFARTTGRVKHQAYLPAPDHDTSVARNSTLNAERLWRWGDDYLKGIPFHGVAIVGVDVIRKNAIDAVAQEPPDFHANLRGWPIDSDPELQKSRRKAIALPIAEEATLLLRD
jgi:hypothetical protein